MAKRVTLAFSLALIVCLPATSFAREISLRVRCSDAVGNPAVLVVDSGFFADTILIGSVAATADSDEFTRSGLGFRQNPRFAVWKGDHFVLRVHFNKPVSDDDAYLGRFSGRDDDGRPVILRDLSCRTGGR